MWGKRGAGASANSKRGKVVQAGEVRSSQIESLRAVAALGVFTAHAYGLANQYSVVILETPASRLPLIGTMGVVMFFSLAGYLLYWPFVKHIYGEGSAVNIKQYAVNRAVRILPLYFFAVAVLLVLREGGGTLLDWGRWLTFTTNFHVESLALNGPLWSVSVEIHFYILLPFLAAGIGVLSRGSLRIAALVLLGLGVLSFVFTDYFVEPGVGSAAAKSLPSKFFYFVPGMLVALLRLHWQQVGVPSWVNGFFGRADLWFGLAIAIIVAQAFQVHWFLGDLREFNKFPDYTVAFFLILGACVLPLRQGVVNRILEWRALAWFGVISYSFYVWHHPILSEIAGREQWDVLSFFALTFPICLAVAALSYRVVESPFLRLRKRWSASSAAAEVSAGSSSGGVDRAEALPASSTSQA